MDKLVIIDTAILSSMLSSIQISRDIIRAHNFQILEISRSSLSPCKPYNPQWHILILIVTNSIIIDVMENDLLQTSPGQQEDIMNEKHNDSTPPEHYFDSTVWDYDEWYKTPVGKFIDRIETELAFELLPPKEGWKVLDAGCGTGNFTFKLARRGCRVTGIDVSRPMLQRAKRKMESCELESIKEQVDFAKMDINDLAFADASFDAIYSMSAFEFIDEPERAFSQLWRVLKPGGNLLIGTINGDSSWGRAYRKKAYADPQSVFNHANFKTRTEIENLNQTHLLNSAECLFIPHGAPEKDFNKQNEKDLSGQVTGGFFCVLWEKPHEE